MEGQNGGNEPTNPQNPGGANTPAPENGDIFNSGAGLGGGGIYSNPDLTIDKDAIPEEVSNSPVNPPAGDAGRVAAAFANTDASQKAAMTPSIVGPTATQSTATGDIKLARGPRPKRSKAPFIIIGIGVVAIAVVAVVLMGVMRGESGSYEQTKTAFLEYANFMLKGKASTEALDTSCVQDDSCYFLQILQSKERFNEIYAESAELSEKLRMATNAWKNTAGIQDNVSESDNEEEIVAEVDDDIEEEVADNTDNDDNEEDESDAGPAEIVWGIQDSLDLYDFIKVFFSHDILKQSVIVDHYIQNGETDAREYVDAYYGTEYENNPYLDVLRSSTSAMSAAVLENLDLYAGYECVDGFINKACFTTNATEEDRVLVSENDQVIRDYNSEIAAYANSPNNFIYSLVRINNLFDQNIQVEQE